MAANWSNGVPTAFDNVCPGTSNVSVLGTLPPANQSVSSINATGGTLTISGGSLTIANPSSLASTLNNVVSSGGALIVRSATAIGG